ncbi:MAG TPA: iron ABC transporter permease [Burkholderiales bacterium]|nr:iron ABC transporter permease [Burkholderiales bacterium]
MTQDTLTPAAPLERRWPRLNRLLLAAFVFALLAMAPVLSVILNIFAGGTGDTWSHLAQTVLPEYVANTLWLCLGVGVGVILVGVTSAWLVTLYEFPGRAVFEWALVLPLAVPAYVMAYTYTDLLQFVGPVQTGLRETFGWQKGDYWFPDIRSLGGAIAMFVFVLYPYVYLLARTAFLERAGGMLEVGRSLGLGSWRSFLRISFPLARPAVAAGAALALMETLADYGTVSYFAVQTFTTGIYRAWFSLGDRAAAAQLSAALLGFVILVLALERLSRGRRRFHDTTLRRTPTAERRLTGAQAVLAWFACALPLAIGFLVPATVLLYLALTQGDAQFGARYFQLAGNSFVLAALTAALAVVFSVLLAYAARTNGRSAQWTNRIVTLGYAVPGSVIAVGVLIPVTRLDNWLSGWIESSVGIDVGLLLTGGIVALVYAYLVRFLSVSMQTVEASLSKITPSMDDAARSLGLSQTATLARVHLPLLRKSMLTAGLLVFVDVMKELPATLVMRPFNFDTLATHAYILVSDERLAEASTSALTIVAVGVLPLVLVSRAIAKSARKKTGGG